MAERRLSLASLVAGILALTVAGLYLLERIGPVDVSEPIVAASALVIVGACGLAASVRRLLGQRRREDVG